MGIEGIFTGTVSQGPRDACTPLGNQVSKGWGLPPGSS